MSKTTLDMEPLSSLAISVIANIATPWITKLFEKGLETKVEEAYVRALKKWTKHDVYWESRKYKERLVDLAEYIQNPTGKTRCKSDIELLEYYKEELRKDSAIWSIVEELLLTNITSIVQEIDQRVKTYLDECTITQNDLINNVTNLLNLQLRRNILSGKYLEDTYLEVDELKERLRFFVDPFVFFQLSCERAGRLSFDNLRWKLSEKNKGDFEFNVSSIIGESNLPDDFEVLYETSRRLSEYLSSKYKELYCGGNTRFLQSHKIDDIRELNDCLHKRVFILTSKAGQGKTNLLCDVTKNVLLKRGIPAAYLNGYELDVNDVEGTFSHKIFSAKKYSLDDILKASRCYCEQHHKPFIFIIDGLNETTAPRELRANLETFLSTVLQYDFVKVLLSCRTEYYNTHFKTIGELFEQDTIIQKDINNRLEEYWNKLEELYFKHFGISCSDISEHIRREFCENLLLFRVFCEVNVGKKLHGIYSIAKEPLFSAYCTKMIAKISEELVSDGYGIATEGFISDFLQNLVDRMVEREDFSNIPLSLVLTGTDHQQRTIVNRFLDNNVLVRKDLMPENDSPFKDSEVINFTFDEFRDYLVSHFLVDIVLRGDKDAFMHKVSKFTAKNHILSEGLTTFLFSYIKRVKNPFALETIKVLPWYKETFRDYIWDVEERNIDEADITLIREFLSKCDILVTRHLTYWERWNTVYYKKLNINILLEHLSRLNLEELRVFFDKTWPDRHDYRHSFMFGYREPTAREEFLDQIKDLYDNNTRSLQHPEQRNLLGIVLYMAAIDASASYVYGDYFNCTKDKSWGETVVKQSHCKELVIKAEQWS